ncbi:MAG: hypothetical protein HXY41_13185 [Chloroflexi bacterium]|jgi:hypothetical protein|nr:hypothetical protein [Chloroflexota bacterium]
MTAPDRLVAERIGGLALSGSVLRDDFRPDGDVDMPVEFDRMRALGGNLYPCRTNSATLSGVSGFAHARFAQPAFP